LSSLDRFAEKKLAALESRALRRTLTDTVRADGIWAMRNGRRLMSFSCNDYLNLSQHEAVKNAARAAIAEYGVGAGASRLVTGNHPLFTELESRLARLKGSESACVFGSGYLANAGIIPALIGPDDLILVDALSHSCIMAGAKLSGAEILTFRHNDPAHVETLLTARRQSCRRAMIATEGVFSMDGDLAPLPALAAIARQFDCWLLSDDAHGIGVVGNGRGSSFAHDEPVDVPLQMGTLSKAIGGYGGYLCASRPVIELIRSRARTLVYSTGLPPALAAAAIAALDIIEGDPGYAALPLAKARRFTASLNLPQAQSPMVPIVIGDSRAALDASRRLEAEGFLVVAIRPPTVPDGTARLRIAFTARHPDREIDRLADAIRAHILAPA
jgi:8-amino-7-oxononanoate synthase